MWRDHPFRQRNKTSERAVGVRVGGDGERGGGGGGGVGPNLKKEVRTPLPTMS